MKFKIRAGFSVEFSGLYCGGNRRITQIDIFDSMGERIEHLDIEDGSAGENCHDHKKWLEEKITKENLSVFSSITSCGGCVFDIFKVGSEDEKKRITLEKHRAVLV